MQAGLRTDRAGTGASRISSSSVWKMKMVRSGPVAWKAPANVWMQFSEDEVQTDTIRAYSDTGSGEVQSLSVSLEEAGRICFVLPDSARVYLTGDKTTAAEEIFQVSIEEDLTGGRITASPMSGKKGTKVTCEGSSRERLPSGKPVGQWKIAYCRQRRPLYLCASGRYTSDWRVQTIRQQQLRFRLRLLFWIQQRLEEIRRGVVLLRHQWKKTDRMAF